MLIFLNKKIRSNFIRKTLLKWEEEEEYARRHGCAPRRHNTGQVAIVLILITAIALIFFIVSFNLGRVSQTKTQVTIAANVAASQMASLVASFGQSLHMGQLGGETTDCGMSGFFMAIVDFVVGTIVAFIVSGGNLGVAIIAAIQGIANAALQVTYVEKFYANLWSSTMSSTLSMRDDFIERGINTALQTAVSDNARVPDLYDSDGDRIWGYNASGAPKDYIGRYGFYYNERLKTLNALDTSTIVAFMAALRDLLYFTIHPPSDPPDPDTWAFFDDTLPEACDYEPRVGDEVPSVCNPCCVPTNAMDPLGRPEPVDYRPDCCDTNDEDECGKSTGCLTYSPYQRTNVNGTWYNFVYDPYLENWENNNDASQKISFREAIGRDDEQQYYHEIPPNFYRDPLNMNGIVQSKDPPMGFLLADASDYRPLDQDYRRGLFPFFYKIADWGADLTTVNPLDIAKHPEHCYWYDSGTCNPLSLPAELNSQRLVLPIDPPTSLIFNRNDFVDNVNTPKNSTYCSNPVDCPALAPDKVGTGTSNILAADNACAQDFLDPLYAGGGFWKRGGDQFCSEGDQGGGAIEWPYSSWCDKHGTFGDCQSTGSPSYPIQCPCRDSNAGPTLWPDDPLDDIIYKVIPGLVNLEKMLDGKEADVLAQTFEEWYQEVSRWIEPKDMTSDQVCFNCTQRGTLWVLLDVITAMYNHLVRWRDEEFVGANCEEVWCVPPLQASNNEYGIPECSGVSPEEAATFASDGHRGGVADIIGCLGWNISDAGTNGAIGNAEKFDHCGDNCTIAHCSDLPRSLLPTTDYDPSPYHAVTNPDGYEPGDSRDEPDIAKMLNCFDHCSDTNCQDMPETKASDPLISYFDGSHDPDTFDEGTDCAGNTPTGDWDEAIITALTMAGPSCDLTDTGDPSTSGWLTNTRQSTLEAENQVAKFTTRKAFLDNRLIEANNLIGLFENARTQLTNFLTCGAEDAYHTPDTDDGPACALIKARIALSNEALGLPYQAIYVWQSDPPPNRSEGYWHAVRVDTRLSGKCDQACGANQSPGSGDPWPRIARVDEDSFWGDIEFRDCFVLRSTDGVVKARVTRFDEERDANNLMFPGGLPIWNFKSNHPSREASGNSIGTDIGIHCTGFMVGGPSGIYKGAFILNEELFGSEGCWRAMNRHLSRGVTSETCAKYYFHEGSNQGFGFQFVPCREF